MDKPFPTHRPLPRVSLLLPGAVALALAACGGGGGGGANVRPTPPPPAPTGLGFTPNVANDASLVVNPPSLPTLPGPRALPQYSQHLQLTNAAGALGAGLTGQGVTIGFVDTGANSNHPALSGRVARNFVHVDPATNDTSVDDKVGHGTVVAQMAAGKAIGSWGGGVAQSAGIVASRIINDAPPVDDGSGAGNEILAGQGYGDFFKAINAELADAGAKIINNSWGGLYWNDPALTAELADAWKDFVVNRGGIVVFANGNSGDDPRYAGEPSDNARLPTLAADAQLEKGWLTVAALDPANPTQLTGYSQQCGSAMNYCLAAPGNVVFIDPQAKVGDASYALYSGGGTSYAAPQVAGAAAVVWAAFPYFSNDQVRQAILGGAKDLGAAGVDPVFGWGLLDITKAAMGPSNFAWGDFSVSFSGNSVWRNQIVGSGGLVKGGTGTLTLAEAGRFTGTTRVDAGGLDIRKGLRSDLAIANGATVWASGALGGNVANSGRFLSGASSPATIAGNFTQAANGNLGVWLGSALRVSGSAALNGTISILGVKSGYTTSAKETLLNASGGVSGSFSSLQAASNVFLDASLAYDPNNVFLNINRIDVTKAVAGLGLEGISLASAVRVESAMQAIDAQLGGRSSGGIGATFIDAAGALQQSGSAANADASLRSLAGELHAASSAMTLDAIDAGRRTLVQRLDTLARAPAQAGGWYRDLSASGQLAQAGYDSVGLDAVGEMVGNDWQVGPSAVVGLAMNRLDQSSWLGASGDHSRGRQREAQLYVAAWRGPWQVQAQLAAGGFQRQMQRHLLLGGLRDTVATPLSGDYVSAFGGVGRRVDLGGLALTPYLGAQFVRIANDGFAERGDTGFGLQAKAWDSRRWQGFAGLRVDRAWRMAGIDLRADARAEWQQAFAARGELFDASFTGLSQWAPLQGIGLASRSQLVGLGLSAGVGRGMLLRFDLSHRASDAGRSGMASLWGSYRF